MEELDFEPVNEIISNKEEIETLDIDDNPSITEENMIKIDRLFNIDEEEQEKNEKINDENEIKKDKKIEKIQIILILFLIVSATIVYFFGYDLLEPLIKID